MIKVKRFKKMLKNNRSKLCDYGCKKLAKFSLRNGKNCCNLIVTNCVEMRKEKDIKIMNRSWNSFLIRARKIYRNKFNYSKAIYKGQMQSIEIICPIHGPFWQTPWHHASKKMLLKYKKNKKYYGCLSCAESCRRRSSRELLIEEIFTKHNIKFIKEKTFPDLRSSIGRKLPLRFDFYLLDFKILIEHDGEQHFNLVFWHKNMTIKQAKRMLKETKIRDKQKDEYALKNKYKLIRISYLDNVESKLRNILKSQQNLLRIDLKRATT